jgi:type II secretory pathway pseudopilin PulG
MKGFFRNNKGETLAETIIALSVLVIAITIASAIIMNSIRNIGNAKSRVIAVNLAREGVEAVRNIRDTNWLFYSDRRRQCWNHDPGVASCDGSTPIQPGVYIVYKAGDGSWQLANADDDPANDEGPPDGDADTIDNNDISDPAMIALSFVDIADTIDSDGDTIPDNDLDFYNHASPADFLGTEVQSTPFSRYITIEYLENVPDPANSAIDEPDDSINSRQEWDTLSAADQGALNRMRVTATVEWVRGATHKAELTTIITDHLGRENLDG